MHCWRPAALRLLPAWPTHPRAALPLCAPLAPRLQVPEEQRVRAGLEKDAPAYHIVSFPQGVRQLPPVRPPLPPSSAQLGDVQGLDSHGWLVLGLV